MCNHVQYILRPMISLVCHNNCSEDEDKPQFQTSLFIYILIPVVLIIFSAGCAMRYKYRKKKPWAHAHHLRRQVAYLKQGMPVRRPSESGSSTGIRPVMAPGQCLSSLQ